MRLLVVTNDYPPQPGGIQQWLGNLIDVFPGEVRVLAPDDGEATTRRGESVVVRGDHRWMLPTRRVRRWIEHNVDQFRADVVLYGAPHPLTLVARKVRKTTGVPYVVMTHGAEVTLPAAVPGLRRLVAAPLVAADGLFAVSKYTAQQVERLTGRPVVTLGAGVDIDLYAPADKADNSDTFTIGCVSRFVPRKGQLSLLRAVRMLRQYGLDVKVVLVGRGRMERRLRAAARKLHVDAEFYVDVAWDALPELYRQFDAFAMPCNSRWLGLEVEGLGIVYLEAAASGIPVVAGDSGGAPETVIEGETGYVVESTSRLADALGTLVTDRRRAAEMGRAGRRFIEAEWTWPRVAERFVSGLASVVSDE